MDTAKKIRKGEVLDWQKLEGYLRSALPDLTNGEMSVSQFHGGHANLTYLLKFGAIELVLRLYKYFPQAPRAYLFCDDESIIGSKFVVVERKTGVVIRKELADCFKTFDRPEERISRTAFGRL